MLHIVGLGLRDGDIPERGKQALEEADVAYAELYTNAITYDLDGLAARTGTEITVLDRQDVEDEDRILAEAATKQVVFLVSGDPLTATTHQDILFRAHEHGIDTEIVHAPSILIAVAETGISIYKLGRTTTLPEPYNGTVPDSPFDVVNANQETGLHTLMLLDIGMEMGDALDIISDRLNPDTDIIAASQLGTAARTIRYGTIADMVGVADVFDVPCSIIIPGTLSDNEQERLSAFSV